MFGYVEIWRVVFGYVLVMFVYVGLCLDYPCFLNGLCVGYFDLCAGYDCVIVGLCVGLCSGYAWVMFELCVGHI